MSWCTKDVLINGNVNWFKKHRCYLLKGNESSFALHDQP